MDYISKARSTQVSIHPVVAEATTQGATFSSGA